MSTAVNAVVSVDNAALLNLSCDRPAGRRLAPDAAPVDQGATRPTDLAHGEVDLGIATRHMATGAQVDVYRIRGRWVTVGDPPRYAEAVHTYHRLHPAGDEHP